MRTVLALTATALLVLAGSGDDDDDESTAAATGDVEVVAQGFSFDPDTIEAEPGETLSVRLTNEDNAAHTFTVEELDADGEADAGGDTTVEVDVPEEGGSFEFVCRFHPQMTGTIDAGVATGAGTGEEEAPASTSTSKDPAMGY